MSGEHENFRGFMPFTRKLKTPCLLFAKWNSCPHCHSMAPKMRQVQARLRGIMPVYLIDAENHDLVCKQLEITGFPEIMVLKKDRYVKKYRGPQDSEKIIQFAKNTANL